MASQFLFSTRTARGMSVATQCLHRSARRHLSASPVPSGHASVVPLSVTSMPLTQSTTGGMHFDHTPLLFIHGLLGSATNFRSIQQKASLSRNTLAVDLRNHGRSPHTNGAAMTLFDLAADVAAVIRQLHQPVDVIGHSLGGKTAMVLAATHPNLIRNLVVVDISPVQYDSSDPNWKSVDGIVRAAHNLNPHMYKSRTDIDRKLAEAVTDPGVRSFVAQNLVPQPDGSYKWRIDTKAILNSMPNFAAFPASALQPQPGMTAHFVAGERSTYLRPQHYDACRRLFPAAQFHSIAGAGHWIHAEKPREFWELMSKLLNLHGSW